MMKTITKEQQIKHTAKHRASKKENTELVSQEKIAQRAYQIWQERGCIHGHDCDDWDQAEQELNGKYSK